MTHWENVDKWAELNERTSTIVEHNDLELKTTQDPVVSDDGKTYTAPALDPFGGEYLITWKVNNFETTDESEACDWDNPIEVKLVK